MWKRMQPFAIDSLRVCNSSLELHDDSTFRILFDSCSDQEPNLGGNSVAGNRIEDTGDGNIALFSKKYTLIIPKPACLMMFCDNSSERLDKWPELFNARYLCLKHYSGKDLFHLRGIESYHNLEALWVNEFGGSDLRDLSGIEYCSRLRYLGLPYQSIQNLGPLEDLPIVSLFIAGNPVTTLEPVNTAQLEDLHISLEMIHLLDGCNFDSLKELTIECYDEDFDAPENEEYQRYNIDSLSNPDGLQKFRERYPQCKIFVNRNLSYYEDWSVGVWNLPGRAVRLNETSVYADGEVSLST